MPKQTRTKLHAIQLEAVKVLELFIKSNQRPDHSVATDSGQVSLSWNHGRYDPETRGINVIIDTETGMEDNPETPYSMRIRLVGFFRVDDQRFDVANIDHWADRNAPLILYPFVREHAFALSARCGFSPMVLPLLEVPTLVPKTKRKSPPKKEGSEA